MFPFESRFVDTSRGHQMHYVDEGAGDPIVLVHGNPAWSFEFRHLIRAQPSPAERAANAALPGHIVGATDWLGEIWDGRSAFVSKPALVLWGNKDIAFRTKELDRWRAELADCEVHEFADCGHFLAEEAPERIVPLLRTFMQ